MSTSRFGDGFYPALAMLDIGHLTDADVWRVGVSRTWETAPLQGEPDKVHPVEFIQFTNGQELRYQTSDGAVAIPGENEIAWTEWGTWRQDQ